jgi:hypothetical protein
MHAHAQVLRSAQANAVHNYGLDGSRLLVGEHPDLRACSPEHAAISHVDRCTEAVMLKLPFYMLTAILPAHADLIHVGKGTHMKRTWPHGRGRAGIRRSYRSHLTVRLPLCPVLPEIAAIAPCPLRLLEPWRGRDAVGVRACACSMRIALLPVHAP